MMKFVFSDNIIFLGRMPQLAQWDANHSLKYWFMLQGRGLSYKGFQSKKEKPVLMKWRKILLTVRCVVAMIEKTECYCVMSVIKVFTWNV